MDRVVALVDMDCFYVQVEQREKPELKGKPCAVVQYNQWKGGGIIAVGYEARAHGVTRQMRGNEAKKMCPDIKLVQVPSVRGKADLTKYREAGAEVIEVLSQFSKLVERASIDEAYIDLTEEVDKRLQQSVQIDDKDLPNSFIAGFKAENEQVKDKETLRSEAVHSYLSSINSKQDVDWFNNQRLAIGGVIAEEMRAAVYEQTEFRCSAGIAHNKILAKLCCGLNKPNRQTIIPQNQVHNLFVMLPLRKVRNLGGKFGASISEDLKVEFMAELEQFPLKTLQEKYGDKNGLWVYEMCRGIDRDPVSARQLPKSIGCSKNFMGKMNLDTKQKVRHWVEQLSIEVAERLTKDKQANGRFAKLLNVSLTFRNGQGSQHASRSCALVKYDAQKIANDSFVLLNQFNAAPGNFWSPPILNIGISASKFIDINESSSSSMTKFLSSQQKKLSKSAAVASPSTLLGSQLETERRTSDKNTPKTGNKSKKRNSGALEGMFNAMRDRQEKQRSVEKINDKQSVICLDDCDSEESTNTLAKEHVFENEKCIDLNTRKDVEKTNNKKGGFFASKRKEKTDDRKEKAGLSSLIFGSSESADEFEDDSIKVKKANDFSSNRRGNNESFKKDNCESNKSMVRDADFDKESHKESMLCSICRMSVYIEDMPEHFESHSQESDGNDNGKDFSIAYDSDAKKSNVDIDSSSNLSKNTKESLSKMFKNNKSTLNNLTKPTKITDETGNTSKSTEIILKDNLDTQSSSSIAKETISNTNNNQKFYKDDYVDCSECGKRLLVWDMPEHRDFHFAQEIMRQENAAHRAETGITGSIGKRKGTGKKGGSAAKRCKVTGNNTLHQFFGSK